MNINWFPGHMAKSTREIESSLKCADVVVYVLDSRAVRSCFNPNFDKMITVPTVFVLNKADITPVEANNGWIAKLSGGKNRAVAIDGTSSSCRKKLLAEINAAGAETLDRQRRRGINAHIRAVVVGVPNTGKSTIINSLCGKARLITGDKAGVTRSATWARVDNTLDILDTPGTLYPKITDNRVGENLAIIGSVRDDIIDRSELAIVLISRLNALDERILLNRFSQSITADFDGLETIARLRGFKQRGGELDTERAAIALIDDFRKGRLGKIALEVVDNE